MSGDDIIFFAWLATWLPFAIAYFISEVKVTASVQQQEEGEIDMRHKLPKRVKIVGDVAKSCARMRKTLAEVMDIIVRARREDDAAIADGRPGSWRHLSAAVCTLRMMMRPKPETVAWHTEIDYYLDREPHLRWVDDIPPLVPGDGAGLSAIEFINGKAKREGAVK